MAKIEVDEEEVRQLVGLRNTVAAVWKDPKARLKLQEAQKLVDPNAKTPDLDAQNMLHAPVEDIRKEFRDYVAKTEAEKLEDRNTRKIADLQKIQDDGFADLRRQKYTDDGIAAVKKLMDEKGILDPLDAAAIFERANPPPPPVTPGGVGGAWNFAEPPAEGEAFVKKLFDTRGNNDLVVEKEAWNTINEMRGVQRR